MACWINTCVYQHAFYIRFTNVKSIFIELLEAHGNDRQIKENKALQCFEVLTPATLEEPAQYPYFKNIGISNQKSKAGFFQLKNIEMLMRKHMEVATVPVYLITMNHPNKKQRK